jgi:hypothetical protein
LNLIKQGIQVAINALCNSMTRTLESYSKTTQEMYWASTPGRKALFPRPHASTQKGEDDDDLLSLSGTNPPSDMWSPVGTMSSLPSGTTPRTSHRSMAIPRVMYKTAKDTGKAYRALPTGTPMRTEYDPSFHDR